MKGVVQTIIMLFAVSGILAFLAPQESTLGTTYKLLYLHLPLLYISLISFVLCAVFSVHALKDDKSYQRAFRAALLGVGFGIGSLAVSAVFMTLTWGAISLYEPRLRVILLIYGLFAVYLAVHRLKSKEVTALFAVSAIILGAIAYNISVGGTSFQVHPQDVSMPFKIWLPVAPSFLGFLVLYYYLFELLENRDAQSLNSDAVMVD